MRQASSGPLAVAVAWSVAAHAVLLFIEVVPPPPGLLAADDPRLEVVLVNARSMTEPLAPQVLAQVHQDGGGDRDQGRRRSPLAAEPQARPGDELEERRRRLAMLEQTQNELLARIRSDSPALAQPTPSEFEPLAEPGADPDEASRLMSNLQAEIARQVELYHQRPRRLTYGVNARGVHYARYVADWTARIEQIGTERYPPEARGRHYDSLVITVEIDRRGRVRQVLINQPSRHEVLNRAVLDIVHAGQPYEPFSPEMAKEGDILQIVRTWTFTNDALQTRSIRGDR